MGLVERFAACFIDNDHDQLRHDPVMAVLAGKLASRCKTLRRWPATRRSTGWSRLL
jgi:hypothetical protein